MVGPLFGEVYGGSINGVGDFSFHGTAAGTLPPGSYYLLIYTQARVENTLGVGGTGSCTASMTNMVFTVPAPGALSFPLLGVLAACRCRRR